MSRRLAREIALRALFQVEAGNNQAEEAVRYNTDELAAPESASEYAMKLVQGTLAHQLQIDTDIRSHAIDWSLERLTGTDRAILRMALYELKHMGADVPAGVVINEAVDLAKIYGDDSSGRFVNGVLGSALRQQNTPTAPST